MKPKHFQRIKEYVELHGFPHKPALLPEKIIRGRVGDCFDCCIINALRNPDLKYVEGIARNPLTGDWIYHAWLTNGRDAFDPTWRMILAGEEHPMKTEYIGIQMETNDVAAFMQATQYKAVLENGWRDPDTANQCLSTQKLPAIWDY